MGREGWKITGSKEWLGEELRSKGAVVDAQRNTRRVLGAMRGFQFLQQPRSASVRACNEVGSTIAIVRTDRRSWAQLMICCLHSCTLFSSNGVSKLFRTKRKVVLICWPHATKVVSIFWSIIKYVTTESLALNATSFSTILISYKIDIVKSSAKKSPHPKCNGISARHQPRPDPKINIR